MMQKFAHHTAGLRSGDGIRSLRRKQIRRTLMPAEIYLGLGVFVSALALIAAAVGLVYVFGGKKVREQIRSEW
jgi:hypothetical protein